MGAAASAELVDAIGAAPGGMAATHASRKGGNARASAKVQPVCDEGEDDAIERKARQLEQLKDRVNAAIASGSRVKQLLEDEVRRDLGLSAIRLRFTANGALEHCSLFSEPGGRHGCNQDSMIAWEDFNVPEIAGRVKGRMPPGAASDVIFCAVFDGHGPNGHLVSQRVRDSLPSRIASLLAPPPVATVSPYGHLDKSAPLMAPASDQLLQRLGVNGGSSKSKGSSGKVHPLGVAPGYGGGGDGGSGGFGMTLQRSRSANSLENSAPRGSVSPYHSTPSSASSAAAAAAAAVAEASREASKAQVERAFRRAFLEMDDELRSHPHVDGHVSGSTAVVAALLEAMSAVLSAPTRQTAARHLIAQARSLWAARHQSVRPDDCTAVVLFLPEFAPSGLLSSSTLPHSGPLSSTPFSGPLSSTPYSGPLSSIPHSAPLSSFHSSGPQGNEEGNEEAFDDTASIASIGTVCTDASFGTVIYSEADYKPSRMGSAEGVSNPPVVLTPPMCEDGFYRDDTIRVPVERQVERGTEGGEKENMGSGDGVRSVLGNTGHGMSSQDSSSGGASGGVGLSNSDSKAVNQGGNGEGRRSVLGLFYNGEVAAAVSASASSSAYASLNSSKVVPLPLEVHAKHALENPGKPPGKAPGNPPVTISICSADGQLLTPDARVMAPPMRSRSLTALSDCMGGGMVGTGTACMGAASREDLGSETSSSCTGGNSYGCTSTRVVDRYVSLESGAAVEAGDGAEGGVESNRGSKWGGMWESKWESSSAGCGAAMRYAVAQLSLDMVWHKCWRTEP
ncbi:unnamed protein product [Closterium sp. NIES-65]|nr:unnamed protein product [Closterium sp. NIES-65]